MIIRWVCEKCNKKWIYPVEKCVFCKGNTAKQKGAKLKVIGITKVSIPSPMHPIVPYNIILLEDEHGNRLPKKTMKDYKIGASYIEEKAKSADAVSVVKVKYDLYEAIRQSLELINYEFKPDDKILIKPSIATAAYPYQAATTNPELLNSLILFLLEKGVRKENILMAEQALIGSDSLDAASKAGVLEVCKRHGILFADASKGAFEEVEVEGCKLRILKEAFGRIVVNVPIMKTNFQLGLSGAVENLSRLTSEETQRSLYVKGVKNTFPLLANALPNLITIADATNGMQGQGPLAIGEPAFLNLVLASGNPANLDAVFCEAFMLDVPSYNIKNIEVVGNELEALKYPIKKPAIHETPHPDIRVIDGEACPACLNIMHALTSKLIGLRGEELSIIMGYNLDEDAIKDAIKRSGRVVVLGDCAIKRLNELNLDVPKIEENANDLEQLLFLKKLLTSKGASKITPIDRVKTKMKMLLSKVVR